MENPKATIASNPYRPDSGNPTDFLQLSIVIPALNEEKSIGGCVKKALQTMRKLGVRGEVVVADNGSTDRTREITEQEVARIVPVTKKGYGNAHLEGFRAAH